MTHNLVEILETFRTHLLSFRDMGMEELPLSKETLELFKYPAKKNNGEKIHLSLEKIQGEIEDCKRCKLHTGRKNIIFGQGNPNADLLIIAGAPGKEEDIHMSPFAGNEGELLTKIIEKGMKLNKKDIYISNIVKCRPPDDIIPEKNEIETCRYFLDKQISSIRPKVIISLGDTPTSALKGCQVSIERERGKWFNYGNIRVMPIYNPSLILKNYTPAIRKQVYEDIKKVMAQLRRS